MNRTQDEKCLWTWIWTKDGAKNETVPEEPEPETVEPEPKTVEPEPETVEPEPETVEPEPEPPTNPRRTSRLANITPEKFAAQDFGRNNLISKRSGNL